MLEGLNNAGISNMPNQTDSQTIIRLSTYTPIGKVKGSCE